MGKDNLVESDRSLTDENLRLIGYSCSECNWQLEGQAEYWEALRDFTTHIRDKHPVGSAHLLRIYEPK